MAPPAMVTSFLRALDPVIKSEKSCIVFPTRLERMRYATFLYYVISSIYEMLVSDPTLVDVEGTARMICVNQTKHRILTEKTKIIVAPICIAVPLKDLPAELTEKLGFDAASCFLFKILVTDEARTVLEHMIILPRDSDIIFGAGTWEDLSAANDVQMRASIVPNGAGLGHINTCAVCRKIGVTFFCSRCRLVWYCGPQCQRANWKAHRPGCDVLSSITGIDVASGSGSS